ncbi:MAG: diaminopimelate epimerase [Butyrivibrio sp.]|nr:diaminopimelate epimerase [Butyrivibrio sp.]
MHFTKMEGCGNDYLYVDGAAEHIEADKKPEIVRKLSDRHFGIGGDGVIFVNPVPDKSADFEMEMYNADGTRAEMCGNGIRCVAKFVYDHGMTDKDKLNIVSAGAVKILDLTVTDGKVTKVKVDMNAPILEPAKVPVAVDEKVMKLDKIVDYPISVLGQEYRITCVSMGNPHAVVFLPQGTDLGKFEIEKVGPYFENHEFFPNRTNTEFVVIDDSKNVHMRVWERGTGETLACGTGCCATVVACVLNDKTEDEITVHVLGGDIVCKWDREKQTVFMTGPATTVFEGDVNI